MKWNKKDGRGGEKKVRGERTKKGQKIKKGQPKKAKGKNQEKSLSTAEEPAPRHRGFQIPFPCPMGPQLGSSSRDGCDAHDKELQEVIPKAAAAPTQLLATKEKKNQLQAPQAAGAAGKREKQVGHRGTRKAAGAKPRPLRS